MGGAGGRPLVTLRTFITEHLERLGKTVLESLRHAREKELPTYRERFHARLPDPGENLRHSRLSDIAHLYVAPPSAFAHAWSELRHLGKTGVYSDEDVDEQIDIMSAELDQIEAEVTRLQRQLNPPHD